MDAGTEIEHVTSDVALASFRDLYLIVWRRNTTMAAARAVRRGCLGFAKTRPRGIAVLAIVEEEAPMPSADAREALATLMRDASDHFKASAVVFEGTGFRAAAVRSVVVGLTMLARQKYPHKVFAGLFEASAWLERELGTDTLEHPFTAQELRDAVASIRHELAERPPQVEDD